MTENKPDTSPQEAAQETPETAPRAKPVFRERKLEGGKTRPAFAEAKPSQDKNAMPKEIGGPEGPEPTRYGDWAFKGRVTDF